MPWAGLGLAVIGLTAFVTMNFTGCTTYTSLSGVRREMRWAVPVETGLAAAGLAIWIAARFVA